MRRQALWLLLLFLAGCSSPYHLSVCSDCFDEQYLASSRCRTPDPLCGSFFGEQLIVNWSVPASAQPGAVVHLFVRFRNRQLREVAIPLHRPRGTYLYRVAGGEYLSSGGILTFKAELRDGEGALLSRWCHHIWVEYIEFSCE